MAMLIAVRSPAFTFGAKIAIVFWPSPDRSMQEPACMFLKSKVRPQRVPLSCPGGDWCVCLGKKIRVSLDTNDGGDVHSMLDPHLVEDTLA